MNRWRGLVMCMRFALHIALGGRWDVHRWQIDHGPQVVSICIHEGE